MSISVVDKYVAKKKNDLLDYAEILESIISISGNKMWNSKKEFAEYAKDIIGIYADAYYFDNNKNRSNPIIYSNDNINFVLRSIIDYFKKKGEPEKLKEWKNETFLLSVIICTSCYVDFATNIVDGNYQDTKSKFKYLMDYFKKTNMLEVMDDKFLVNDLFDTIKKNIATDTKYIELLKGNNAKNNYSIYSKSPLYYIFDFEYEIPDIDEKDMDIAEKLKKNYIAKFKEISFELLCTDILVKLISNEDMGGYLIPADEVLKKKPNLLNIFNNKYYKDYIKLLIKYEDDAEYNVLANSFITNGGKVLYVHEGTEAVIDNFFTSDMDVLVYEEFMKNNQENIEKWKNNKVNFVIRNKEDK